MHPQQSITRWIAALLPQSTAACRGAALCLVQALLQESGCKLCRIARTVSRNECARSNRQYLFRWLNRPHWNPPEIYAHLLALLPYVTARRRTVVLLMDYTCLSDAYVVLQFSVPFQGRALPLLRLTRPGRGGEGGLRAMLVEGLAWLGQHLPGETHRYLLVGDRGFPSHLLIKELQRTGWRYALRIKTAWRMEHPAYAGVVQSAVGRQLHPGMRSRWFGHARFGAPEGGKAAWCRSHMVWSWELNQAEPWILITSEAGVRPARQAYRQRVGIECEFRDIKEGRKGREGDERRTKRGEGVSWLMEWRSLDRVTRLLAWVAVREWRLACLWLVQRLGQWRGTVEIGGRLSWFTITREWLRRHPLASSASLPLKQPFCESP